MLAFLLSISSFSLAEGQEIPDISEAPEPSAVEVPDEATPAEQPLEVLVVEAVETVTETEEPAGEAQPAEEDGGEAVQPAAVQPAEETVAPQRSYTVTFRSGEQHSVIAGDAMTALSLILDELGEDGEVINVTSSNDELFTAETDAEGNWILVSKQPFETAETLSVELEGRSEPVVLNVTDPDEVLVDLSKGNVTINDSGEGSTEAKPRSF